MTPSSCIIGVQKCQVVISVGSDCRDIELGTIIKWLYVVLIILGQVITFSCFRTFWENPKSLFFHLFKNVFIASIYIYKYIEVCSCNVFL